MCKRDLLGQKEKDGKNICDETRLLKFELFVFKNNGKHILICEA